MRSAVWMVTGALALALGGCNGASFGGPTHKSGKAGGASSGTADGNDGNDDHNGDDGDTGSGDAGGSDGVEVSDDAIPGGGANHACRDDADASVLCIASHRLDGSHEGTELTLSSKSAATKTVAWPDEDETARVAGVCNPSGETVLTLSAVLEGKTYHPSNGRCFVGIQKDAATVVMGFEADCDSTDYEEIDDAIATLRCSGGLRISDLRLDPKIDFDEWE